ncbi:MAG: hypothetical protein OXC10_04245 [Rhodospirillaceae bacterium]|nr:hypothetical protein [Rhodospirillaceae bacterium]
MFKIEGLYHVNYSGPFGHGFGQFVLKQGEINGSDAGSGEYRGKYWRDPFGTNYILDIELVLSQQNLLVTDGIPRMPGTSLNFQISICEDKIGKPCAVDLPTGPIILTISRVSDLHQDAA